jgi:adenine-specific DNA-methyltransferase
MPELHFKGKEYVYNHHLNVPFRPLIAQPDKSIGEDSGNLIIHGDNLHALKALLPRYAGKVDCIFIDPPYNTGTENWSYNDNVNSPIMQEWLNSNPINKDDMLRHDKWCCLMFPRFRLLKELLSQEGVIAVTIDDNELDSLLLIMDEIFGEQNRLCCAAWLSDPSGGKQKGALRVGHEYVVIYGGGSPELSKEENVEVELNLEDSLGCYAKGRELNKWGANSERKDRPTMFFKLVAPDGTEVFPIRNDGKEGCWRFGVDSKFIKQLLQEPDIAHWEKRPYGDNVVVNGENERWVPYEKIRDVSKAFGWSTWLESVATNADGTKAIKDIFGSKVFETPKPVALLEWIIGLHNSQDALILDSFAGSGTTAHAVLAQNAKDGGNRQFILVECEDYADSLTAERVRRVINGYEFEGMQKEELHRKRITWSNFSNDGPRHQLLQHVASIENVDGLRFDKIKKEIKDGELIVTGEKKITEHVPGLGGGFTFYTLGEPLDIDKILTGESLPDYFALGAWLFHTATGQPLNAEQTNAERWYLGSSNQFHVWLIYKPELDFLKSPQAALTLSVAEGIGQTHKDKSHLVFAAAKYAPNRLLLPLGVEYAPLPFALYRIEKD